MGFMRRTSHVLPCSSLMRILRVQYCLWVSSQSLCFDSRSLLLPRSYIILYSIFLVTHLFFGFASYDFKLQIFHNENACLCNYIRLSSCTFRTAALCFRSLSRQTVFWGSYLLPYVDLRSSRNSVGCEYRVYKNVCRWVHMWNWDSVCCCWHRSHDTCSHFSRPWSCPHCKRKQKEWGTRNRKTWSLLLVLPLISWFTMKRNHLHSSNSVLFLLNKGKMIVPTSLVAIKNKWVMWK